MKYTFTYLFALSILLCNLRFAYSQATSGNNANFPVGANDYIGWTSGTNTPLVIKNEDPMPISFYTNAGAGAFNNMRMTILGNGKVGIGINNPLWQLDVADEINISQPRNYYMIGGETVLHNAGTENIFTGVNCGKDILAGNASGNMNTFNGFSAGEFASGNDNVFIGDNTGRYSNGQSNIFIGTSAGIDNLGDYNSIVGFTAGMYLTTGNENTFMGLRAGECNTSGSNNTFMGALSGSSNAGGSNNTFIGAQAGSRAEQVNNAIAIGYKAEVRCNDCTVLGGKFVGINTTTPQTTLEVNGTITTKQLIIANENQKQDVTAMLNELKNEIAQLKEQINQLTKN